MTRASAIVRKPTDALINDIEDAKRFNFSSVPKLNHDGKLKKPNLFSLILQRYYIEICLYGVEKWEIYLSNAVTIAIFFVIMKSLFNLVAPEHMQHYFF